jgi:hypothetical protein
MEAELMILGGAPDPFRFDSTPIPKGRSFQDNSAAPITVFA